MTPSALIHGQAPKAGPSGALWHLSRVKPMAGPEEAIRDPLGS